jgi:hypothetical protein
MTVDRTSSAARAVRSSSVSDICCPRMALFTCCDMRSVCSRMSVAVPVAWSIDCVSFEFIKFG